MTFTRIDAEVLSADAIIGYVVAKKAENRALGDKLWQYYLGENPPIMTRKAPDPNSPDNKVPVSYGRKITNTVVGYMYKPGLITYDVKPSEVESENTAGDEYMEIIRDLFFDNNEPLKTQRLGKHQTIFGVAYEIHYTTVLPGETVVEETQPRFVDIDPREMIALYDMEIEPELAAVVRFYPLKPKVDRVEVYYANSIAYFNLVRENNDTVLDKTQYTLVPINESPHFYGEVPVAVYYNNEEQQGDFKAVTRLIDAYDVLVSDSLNEFDRFAWAYLLLAGMKLATDPKEARKVMDRIRSSRVFQNLENTDQVKFLTKEVESEFIRDMKQNVRQQIHIQSHIPDFTDERFKGDISGVAIKRLLFDFENLAATKQGYFQEGLEKRFILVNKILDAKKIVTKEYRDVTIAFHRNLAGDLLEIAETAAKMLSTTSRRTALTIYPAEIVPDVDKELEWIAEEKEMVFDLERALAEGEEEEKALEEIEEEEEET